eukprot:scaffold19676_cov95-Skeletonema_dohrnii-CCMP3373.AAC.3
MRSHESTKQFMLKAIFLRSSYNSTRRLMCYRWQRSQYLIMISNEVDGLMVDGTCRAHTIISNEVDKRHVLMALVCGCQPSSNSRGHL